MKTHSSRAIVALLALAMLLTCLPMPALAGCAHTCPRKFSYSSWSTQQYNETSHRYARTVYEYCSACNARMSTKTQYQTEAHSFNSSRRCKTCGYEKPCDHRNATVSSDNSKVQILNSTHHVTRGTLQYHCRECGKSFSRDAKENKQPHSFVSGKCTACGYAMVLLATPQPTQKVCAHTNVSKSIASTQACPKNESYHNINELVQEKCKSCGEILRTYETTRQEQHSIKDGVCKVCSMQLACLHKQETIETMTVAATPGKDNNHILQRMQTRICADCSVVLGTEMKPLSQPHTFAGGFCIQCGAAQSTKIKLEVDVTEVDIFIIEQTWVDFFLLEAFLDEEFWIGEDAWQFDLFAERPFTGPQGGFSGLPSAGEDAAPDADFGLLIAALDHPYGVRERYAMRVGEEATLFAMLLAKQQEDAGEEADASSSATRKFEEGVTSQEDSQEAVLLFTEEDIVNVLAENFDWDTDGGVSLEGSLLAATNEGSGSAEMLKEDGFTIVDGGVSVSVFPADDPYIWFIDPAFVQGNLPLLMHDEQSGLAVSLENMGYDPQTKSLSGAYVSRVPLSLGIMFFLRGETNSIADTSLFAPLQTQGNIAHFGEPLSALAAPVEGIYAYPEDAPGQRKGFSLPLEGIEYFMLTMPWQSPMALGTNFANLLALSFLATPEAGAVQMEMADVELLDMARLGRLITDEMLKGFTMEQLCAEDSPARTLFAQIARGEAVEQLLLAAEQDADARGMAMAFVAGTAAEQFCLVDDGLRDAFGIDVIALMEQCAEPELMAALQGARSLSEEGRARDWAELEAVSACVELARYVDESWGQAPLAQAFVSLEIEEK